jgi:ADP-ribose pyrophosphatase
MSASPDSYTVVESRALLDHAWVRVLVDTLEHAGRRYPYYYLESPVDSVAVVAVTAGGQVVLTRQYRHPVRQVIYDLPAGRLGPGEDPEAGARRELEEETGDRAGRVERLGSFNPFPGSLKVTGHLFFAAGLSPGPQRLDEGEELQVRLLPFAEALSMVLRGECLDGALQLGLLLAAQKGLAPS